MSGYAQQISGVGRVWKAPVTAGMCITAGRWTVVLNVRLSVISIHKKREALRPPVLTFIILIPEWRRSRFLLYGFLKQT